jgi:hypothetical protein
VSVNSVNIVHSVNKVVNPYKDNYHYVGGVPHTGVPHAMVNNMPADKTDTIIPSTDRSLVF